MMVCLTSCTRHHFYLPHYYDQAQVPIASSSSSSSSRTSVARGLAVSRLVRNDWCFCYIDIISITFNALSLANVVTGTLNCTLSDVSIQYPNFSIAILVCLVWFLFHFNLYCSHSLSYLNCVSLLNQTSGQPCLSEQLCLNGQLCLSGQLCLNGQLCLSGQLCLTVKPEHWTTVSHCSTRTVDNCVSLFNQNNGQLYLTVQPEQQTTVSHFSPRTADNCVSHSTRAV